MNLEVTNLSKEKKPYFPMFVDLSQKKVVVVGAGTIAKRRIRTLLDFTDRLVVIAPEVNRELIELEEAGKLTILRKKYERDDIYDADLVIAATNDFQTNNDIYNVCKCTGITVNVCSDKNKCDFYFPGIARKDNIVAGVTASGNNHRAAKEAVEKIRSIL
ncbi:MAG: bifunctional precorrin-2 dehydrogenase/sirohydrochlorin ferrochelatase [Eubacteriales bacterium]|nr:bifunctional precorrin-2 dehydrogenase/sirohydrochlorin ferrochelatase [Eubacteriales bacterium]